MKNSNNPSPQIYIACLAAYNTGKLHGRWVDATQEVDDIWAEISDILKTSSEPCAEEWAVHDYEGFGDIELGEYPDIDRVVVLAQLLEEYGKAFSLWYKDHDRHCCDLDCLEDTFSEQYQGAYDSEAAFVDDLLEGTGMFQELPEWARHYFDSESYARDLRLSGDYSFTHHKGQVYVYTCHR